MDGMGLHPTALDALDNDGRRQTLLDVAKLETPTLSMLGGQPADQPIFVLDTGENLVAATEADALIAYARSNYLDVSEPKYVPGSDEFDAGVRWEIRLLASGSDAGVLATGDSLEHAKHRMVMALKELAGDRVIPLRDWAKAQAAGSFETVFAPAKVPKRREPQWAIVEVVQLQPLPVAPGVSDVHSNKGPLKIRRKEAFEALAEPTGIRLSQDLASAGAAMLSCSVQTTHYDGLKLANQHDLMAAARMGFDVADLLPFPNDVAHRFLVSEETRRAMRRRGYVELTDFDPGKLVRLRTSLPEFSEAITGEATETDATAPPEKPHWPPAGRHGLRVVIVLDRARLACDVEPEYELVVRRDIIECAGRLWVAERQATDHHEKTHRSTRYGRAGSRELALGGALA